MEAASLCVLGDSYVARINVESDLESHEGFWSVLAAVGGDREKALGRCVRFFRLAQSCYGKGEPMTEATLRTQGLECMVTPDWVREVPGGYEVVQAEKHFGWYKQKRTAARAGGLARSSAPRDEHGRFQPDASRDPAGNPATPGTASPLTPSPAPSLVQLQNKESIGALACSESRAVATVSNLPTKEEKAIEKAEEKRRAAAKANSFVGAYVKAYQSRFPGSRPEDLHDPKVRGQIMALAKDYPIERLCELIQVYFQLEAKWFGTKGYDFMTFRNNLQVIGQALDSGTDPSGAAVDWNRVFA